SPDGEAVASASGRGSIVLHDRATGKRLRSFPGASDHPSGGVYGIAFAPDGKTWAAAGSSRQGGVWAGATGKQHPQGEVAGGSTGSLTFSHDGRTLAGRGEQHRVQVWDVRAGKELVRIAHPPGFVLALALAPDGKTLATAGMDRKAGTALYLWDTANGR